ncbi:MAG: ATP-binding protein [Gemmataceae bacterium]
MSEKAPHSESVGKDVVKLPSNPDHARVLQDRIEALLGSTNATDRDRFCVRLALEEALVNAIKHGNQLDPSKSVTVRFHVFKDHAEFHISDEGPGFDPDDLPDPTDIENLERPCGRGVMLIRHYMHDVEYFAPGNAVLMRRYFQKAS